MQHNQTSPKRRVSPAAAAMAQSRQAGGHEDRMAALLAEARTRIQAQMTPAQIEDPSDADLRLAGDILRPLVNAAFSQALRDGVRMTQDPETVVRQILDDIFGFGPLAPYLADPEVEEVICNGPDDVWVIHAARGKERTGARFRGGADLVNFVNRAAAATGGRWLDKANPKLDARMRDGSRLHAVMEPLTVNVPVAVTIRRHRLVARTIDDIVRLGTLTPPAGEFLRLAVTGRLNLVVAGGTASGKCLAGDQPVVLGDGRIVPIGELVEQEFASRAPLSDGDGGWYVPGNGAQVVTWNGRTGGFERAPILAYTRTPAPSELVRLSTRSGREITVTEAHPFFALGEGVIQQLRAKDLRPGQPIAVPTSLPPQAPSELPSLFDFLPRLGRETSLYVLHQNDTFRTLIKDIKERKKLATASAVRDSLETDGVRVPLPRGFYEWSASTSIPLPSLLALLECADWPLQSLGEEVWLKSKTTPKDQAIRWPTRPTESMMCLLGWILADGYVAKDYVEITKKAPTVQKELVALAREAFRTEATVYDYGYRAPVVRLRSKTLAALIHTVFEVPLTKKSQHNAIPQWVLSLPDRMIAALLSGLFDGDAHLGDSSLEFSTVSETLAHQVHYLLLRLGVDNSLIERSDHCRVMVYANSLSRLTEVLAFYTPHKAEKLATWRGMTPKHSNYGIPGLAEVLRDARISGDLSIRDLSERSGLSRRVLRMYESGDRRPTCATLRKLINSLPDNEATGFIRWLTAAPVKWDAVVEIEHVEHLSPHVYDLVVSGTHTFVAGKGGIVVHNTNLLNALCDAASDGDRFILVEDTPELQVQKADVVQLTTREKAEEAQGYTMADLVIEALRMRPDRIITGEARGPEVVDVLMAANTGHDGQMLTVHANSTRDVIQRLETMYLLRGTDVPLVAIRRQVADAFQVVVFIKRVFIGKAQKRFVTEIAEMQPSQFMEGDKVVVQNVFEDRGQGLRWTGYFPERLARRLAEHGVHLTPQFFRGREWAVRSRE
jgi:Flp pilus assembly CpaF family ATPase